MIFEIILLILAIPIGYLLAWLANDELHAARLSFRILIILSVFSAIIFYFLNKPYISLTLIFISHDLNLVYRYADKVICLNRAMFCFGTPKETLTPSILDNLYGEKMLHHLHQNDE